MAKTRRRVGQRRARWRSVLSSFTVFVIGRLGGGSNGSIAWSAGGPRSPCHFAGNSLPLATRVRRPTSRLARTLSISPPLRRDGQGLQIGNREARSPWVRLITGMIIAAPATLPRRRIARRAPLLHWLALGHEHHPAASHLHLAAAWITTQVRVPMRRRAPHCPARLDRLPTQLHCAELAA
jgi:hypothetical protein